MIDFASLEHQYESLVLVILQITMPSKSDSNAVVSSFSCLYFA